VQLGAAALIRQAEVIVYDDLGTQVGFREGMTFHACPGFIRTPDAMQSCGRIPQAAVEAFAPAATRVYVGKRGLQKSFKQHQIDALLVEHCTKVMLALNGAAWCTRPVFVLGSPEESGMHAQPKCRTPQSEGTA